MGIILNQCSDFAVPYLDDIIIFSPTVEKHLEHIQKVFDSLREHNLKLKLKKCFFMLEETNYLGFVISSRGIKADHDKVKVIRGMAFLYLVILMWRRIFTFFT